MLPLICLDVDGTLVGRAGEPSAALWSAADAARERGQRSSLDGLAHDGVTGDPPRPIHVEAAHHHDPANLVTTHAGILPYPPEGSRPTTWTHDH